MAVGSGDYFIITNRDEEMQIRLKRNRYERRNNSIPEGNIIGKNLFTDDVVYQLDNGKLEGVYSDKIVFSDLAKTENGFAFNMTTVTHELIYNIDGKGSRMTIAKDYTGTSVFRYELAMRKAPIN